jgi:hypothetical protein
MGVTASRAVSSDAEGRLRHMQSIADAALSGMDASQQLTALLERVREIMQADTAAVLLLDPSSGQLIATAASGAAGGPPAFRSRPGRCCACTPTAWSNAVTARWMMVSASCAKPSRPDRPSRPAPRS